LFWLVFGWASNVLGIWVTSLIFDGVTYDDKVWVLAVAGYGRGVAYLSHQIRMSWSRRAASREPRG